MRRAPYGAQGLAEKIKVIEMIMISSHSVKPFVDQTLW